MKCANADALMTQWRSSEGRLAVLYGPDAGLVEVLSKQLAETFSAAEKNTDKLTLYGQDVVEKPSVLFDALNSFSLLSQRTLVVVRQATDRVAPLLQELMSQPLAAERAAIFMAGELRPNSKLRQLAEKSPSIACMAAYHDDARTLSALIQEQLRDYTVADDAKAELIQLLGDDRMVSLNELEKLKTFLGDRRHVSRADILTAIAEPHTSDVNELILCLANGDFSQTAQLFHRLQQAGVADMIVLRSWLWHLSRLDQLNWLMQSNRLDASAAIEQFTPKIFYQDRPHFIKQLKRWSRRTVLQALSDTLQLERDFKSLPLASDLIIAHGLVRIAQLAG